MYAQGAHIFVVRKKSDPKSGIRHSKSLIKIEQKMNPVDVNVNELIVKEGTTLIDVREPFELMMGKVEGGVNIPLNQVPQKVDEFKAMPKPIVLYCQSGNRSGQATMFLRAKGVEEVYNGGGWQQVAMVKKGLQ
jgi:phage shock protein E